MWEGEGCMHGREGCMREEKPDSLGGGCDTRERCSTLWQQLASSTYRGFWGSRGQPPLPSAQRASTHWRGVPPPRAGCRASAPPASRRGNLRQRRPHILTSLHLTCPSSETKVCLRGGPTLHPAPSP